MTKILFTMIHCLIFILISTQSFSDHSSKNNESLSKNYGSDKTEISKVITVGVYQLEVFKFKNIFKKIDSLSKKINNKKTRLEASKMILIVEDNEINAYALKELMRRWNYEFIHAEDGRKALEILEKEKVDLILMDIQLPYLNGIEATRIYRSKEKEGKRVPIIALTAYVMNEDREECLKAGMDDFIPKPVKADTLKKMLQKYLVTI
ncbi:MAG TPA: hypothetical protein DHW82_10285 [Spirochaetia bacterium]|nr:MAG: hypothetical protein A2Y41_00620 [Spirochaetes bacterium GWB1_36_13]HCL57379.1 hypothetical protein [Spirochaetia bacterium]